jgi:hypothetical protein
MRSLCQRVKAAEGTAEPETKEWFVEIIRNRRFIGSTKRGHYNKVRIGPTHRRALGGAEQPQNE